MPRALFEKVGNAIYISHLDLMRLFQRGFKRAGLALTHTQGYNPRPSVSIALPLSLGVESVCELLDFDLEGEKVPNEEICARLNAVLPEGVRVLCVYEETRKLKHLELLECAVTLEYDKGIPTDAQQRIAALFAGTALTVEKKSKNGVTEQDILPMIRRITVTPANDHELVLHALVCCQNPSLNPMQLSTAVVKYLPDLTPDFVRCRRLEVYDAEEKTFR